jgi:glycosyltransferase involved in cell wall biosynthesis
MKIALISWESLAGPSWTDAAVVVTETARALAARGHELHVFTARGPMQPAEAMMDGVHYHRCAHDPYPDPRDDVESFGRAAAYGVRSEEGRGGFGVLHGFDWPGMAVLSELHSEGRRPAVWSLFSAGPEWRPPRWMLDEAGAEVRGRYHPDEFADRVIVPSTQARDAFVGGWGVAVERVEVVHPGIDPNWPGAPVDPASVKAGYGIDTFDPVVLYVGPLTAAGRPGLLVDAMPRLLEDHPNAKVVFAGAGEMREHLEDRAVVLGIETAVRLPGEPAGGELRRLVQACDAVCLPQRSQRLLSPFLEAWAAAKPVVTTPSHAAADFVWHEVTGYVCEESPDAIAGGLLWLFSDFERCRWIGANGRRAVEDAFGWPAIAGRLLDCYERVGGVTEVGETTPQALGRPR